VILGVAHHLTCQLSDQLPIATTHPPSTFQMSLPGRKVATATLRRFGMGTNGPVPLCQLDLRQGQPKFSLLMGRVNQTRNTGIGLTFLVHNSLRGLIDCEFAKSLGGQSQCPNFAMQLGIVLGRNL